MLWSILSSIAALLFTVVLENYYNGGHLLAVEKSEDFIEINGFIDKIDIDGWIIALLSGATFFFAHHNAVEAHKPSLGIIACVMIVVLDVVFAIRWWGKAHTIRELLFFATIMVGFYFLFRGNAYVISILWDNAAATIFMTQILPLIALVGMSALGAGKLLYYHYRGKNLESDKDKKNGEMSKKHRRLVSVMKVLAVLIAIVMIVVTCTACGEQSIGGQSDSAGTWYKFYNTELQFDSNESNNFDFGSNPYKKTWTAKDYDADFRTTLKNDPAIGAADMAWFDANVGTRYLGEFYESCKHDWAKTINEAKAFWMGHQKEYYQTLDAFFAFLDTGTPEVTKADNLTDQMYMNPYTSDKVPDVIVLKTLDHKGLFLTYNLKIKGSSNTTGGKPIAVSYRINCRYQPTNVAGVMGITPQSVVPKSSEPSTIPYSPYDPTTKPSDPTKPTERPSQPETVNPTAPTTNPTYNKDPSQGTQGGVVDPNDDPGPGPDTNNGVGSTTAPDDQPGNSNHYDTYDDYRDDVDEMGDANENTPPARSDPDTNVDDNSDNGTGNGGIDTPTPTTDPARTFDGEPISNDPDNPAGAWGGPPD